ncbi:MAG: glycoside hydrolase family 10 protein [Phycisphaerales bacterium]
MLRTQFFPAIRAACILGLIFALTPAASAQIGRPAEKPKPVEPTQNFTVKPREGEVRATWLRFGEGDALATPARTAETMRRLREIGFNTVYVSVWQDGYPMWPSDAFAAATSGLPGAARIAPEMQAPRDLLSEALIEAHRHGLLFIADFDGGLASTRRDRESPLRRREEWNLKDAKGAAMGPRNSSWLNPAHPDVRALMIALVSEVVDRYDIDGVQINERFCWADPSLGYDPAAKDLFAKENSGAAPPADPREPGWTRWKTQKGVTLLREIAAAVKARRPGLIMSFAAPTPKEAIDQWCCDWPSLVRLGLFDEIVVRAFRPDMSAFKVAWDEAVTAVAGRRPEMTIGIRASGPGGPDLTWTDLKSHIEIARTAKAGGFALISDRAITFTYAAALTDFFAVSTTGQVRHPLRPLTWRPGVLKPERMNTRGRLLVVRGLRGGVYRVIAGGKEPGVWLESTIRIAEASAVITEEQAAMLSGGGTIEFLVDRRPENAQAIPDPSLPTTPPPGTTPSAPKPAGGPGGGS